MEGTGNDLCVVAHRGGIKPKFPRFVYHAPEDRQPAFLLPENKFQPGDQKLSGTPPAHTHTDRVPYQTIQ